MQRQAFDFQGLRLSYLEAGEQNAEKLVIAHANGYAAGMYAYIIEALAGRFHICALDFAGHGESEGTLHFSSWNFFRDQLLALLDHKGWGKAHAIGHSLGGGSLLRAAQVNAGRFVKIIAFDPVMLNLASITYVKLFGNPMAKVARTRRASFASKAQALKIFSRHPAQRGWQKESIAAYVEYCLRETNDGARLSCDPALEAQIFSQTEYAHLFRFKKITCETRLILPPRSHVCPPRVAAKIVRNHAKSAIQRLPGTGHLLPFENHAKTLDVILSSL